MAWTKTGNIKGPPASATIPANVQTGTSYTLVAGDAGKAVQMSNASANTVTLDASVFAVGSVGLIRQTGAGQTTVAAASGTTIIKGGPTLKTAQKGSMLSWRCDSSTLIYINGECAAS